MAQSAAEHGKEQLPLRDVVLCSTNLPQDARIRLADIAQSMGASNRLDLTGEVTHLVVGDSESAKYTYVAKERPDIVVLSPSWIDAIRDAWMEGGDVDVAGLERTHRCRAFAGLKLCITGFPDLADRDRISRMVEEEGAEYHGDLTKQVTHLLVANSDSAKYRAAKEWGIRTVSMKWVDDSIERGMALDSKYYDPTLLEKDQGKGAYRKEVEPRTSLGKRLRNDGAPTSGTNENGKRKLRRHASKRLVDHSQDMWQDISAVDTSVVAPSETDQWTAGDEDSQLALGRSTSRRQSRKSMDAAQAPANAPTLKPEGIFSGWRITMQGFEREKTDRLTQYLLPNGAQVVKRLEDLESNEDEQASKHCILVPHMQPSQHMHITRSLPGAVTATEWWVERCIHYKRIMDPEHDVLSQPLWNLDILGFSKLTVSTTGFSGVDYRQIAEAVKLAGAKYQEQLLPTISVLVSGSATVKKEKAYYASKHKIPVVTAEWLWTCLRSRRKTTFDRFKIELPQFDPSNVMGQPSVSSPVPSDALKGSSSSVKGKDNTGPQRLSNTRNRHVTPSLPLQAHRAEPKQSKPAGPFVHEDEEDEGEKDGPADQTEGRPSREQAKELPNRSAPLRSISSNASSHKPSSSDKAGHMQDNDPDVADEHLNDEKSPATAANENDHSPPDQPPPRAHADLTANLASLVEQQQRRATSSEHHHPAQRLKDRKLGRAASGSSFGNRTTTGSTITNPDSGVNEASFSESSEGVPGARAFTSGPEGLPSTQIGYETIEAEAARQQMAKRMGTSYSDEGAGTRLASLGTVKDSSGMGQSGAAGRNRNRPRR